MTSKNQIWKRANAANEARCIALLQSLFPSLSRKIIVEEGSISSYEDVTTKKDALERIRIGLKSMTETEAAEALIRLDSRPKTRDIRF